jgi:hypothetical protein
LSGLDGGKYVISMSKTSPGIIEKHCRAAIWGRVSVGIGDMFVRDYLGLFEIVYEDINCARETVNIRPALHEPLKNDLLAFFMNEITVDDAEDETSDKAGFLSQPGYTYRPYVPPDALNRINWKLLAKLDKYMVRENEYIKNQNPVIVLDRKGLRAFAAGDDGFKAAALLEERVVEGVLAMLLSMVRQNIICKIYYFSGGVWQMAVIGDEEHIVALQEEFSRYAFDETDGENAPRVPPELIGCGDKLMLFTCAFDETLASEIAGYDITVVCPNTMWIYQENVWFVNEAYDFYAA